MLDVSKMSSRSALTLLFVFCVEFCYMGMELLASRLLSPYFGTTLDVWTATLAVVLGCGAIGNAQGASWCAQGKGTWARICGCVAIAACWFSLMPSLAPMVSSSFIVDGDVAILDVLSTSIVLFAAPALCFGCVSPMLVERYSEGRESHAGLSSGTVSAIMSAGGIVGTAACGFWLVPWLGATKLAYVMSAVLYALAALFCAVMVGGIPHKSALMAAGLVVVSVGAVGVGDVTRFVDDTSVWRDTQYGRVQIFESSNLVGEPTRVLHVDGGYESAMYVAPEKSYDLVFDYARRFREIADTKEGPVVCLGGGAYSIPRNLAHDGRQVTCVEIDPGITDIAREYFGLAEAEKSYDLTCVNADARVWLEGAKGTGASIIFNDTFAGNVPARTLAVKEAIEAAKEALAPDGLYVVNAIGRAWNSGEGLLADEVATVGSVFDNVWVFTDSDSVTNGANLDNYLIVGSDDASWIDSFGATPINVSAKNMRVLTDDWSPVEWLVTQER